MRILIAPLERFFLRWVPDAFVVAILLSLLTFGLAVTVTGYGVTDTISSWGDGFWNLLTFTNQITLTLLLGFALANTPAMRAVFAKAATFVMSPFAAYAAACFITGICAVFSWGLSLIAAGIVPRYIGNSCRERGIPVHYPLLVASSFSGFVVWHQGLSSSIGLAVATPGHFLEEQIGIIPISATLFTPWNMISAAVVICILPFIMAMLRPKSDEPIQELAPDHFPEEPTVIPRDETPTPSDRLENSRIVTIAIIVAGLAYIAIHFFERRLGLTLNIFNFTFLIVGLLMAGSMKKYIDIILEGGRIAVPFLLQYPFYAGIAAVMQDSGLANLVIEGFVSISTPSTLPLLGFFSGGLVNIFIPSGGGQWAVQGPIMMSAAAEIGADLPRVAMGVALGDQWTNLIHPLTLIPITALARVQPKEIMSYCFMALMFTGIMFTIILLPV